METTMNLYHIQYDSTSWWVEAPGVGAAVKLWKAHCRREDPTDPCDEEPDSIARIHDEPVIRLDATEARLGACPMCPICSPLPFPTPAAVERAKAPATEPIIGPRRQDHIADPGNMVEPPPPADGAEEMAASADTSTQDERRLLAIASQIVAPLRALSDKRVPPYPRLIGQLQHTITDALTSHAAAKTRALREELEKVKRAKESLWHSAARLADELDAMKARAEKAEEEAKRAHNVYVTHWMPLPDPPGSKT